MRWLILVLLFFITVKADAQIKLNSGQYTTEDGYYTVTINFSGDKLTLIEPNTTSVYEKVEPNIFRFIHPRSKTDYRIEIIDPNTIQTFKPNVNNSRFTIKRSSSDATANNDQFKRYFALAEHYKAKMISDKKDAQLWSFCAAAAMARSSMNEEGFADYAGKVASSVKLIIVNKAKCPCEDAIPIAIWNAAK